MSPLSNHLIAVFFLLVGITCSFLSDQGIAKFLLNYFPAPIYLSLRHCTRTHLKIGKFKIVTKQNLTMLTTQRWVCKLCNISGPWAAVFFVIFLLAILDSSSWMRFNNECLKMLIFQNVFNFSTIYSILWLAFSQRCINGCLHFFLCFSEFRFLNFLRESNLFVYLMVSGSCDNRAQERQMFDRTVWFCTLWNIYCELLRMTQAASSAALVVLERELALEFLERFFSIYCACDLELLLV